LSGSIESCDDEDDLKELVNLLRKVDPAEADEWEEQLIAREKSVHFNRADAKAIAAEALTENAFASLQQAATQLDPVYKKFTNFLTDWYMDLPWDENGSKAALNFIMKKKDFADVCELVKKNYNLDLREEFKVAIREE
jgi:deoxyribodipyrimidine photolyase